MRTPFLGTAYTARNKELAAQQCINLFPELTETKEGKGIGAFYMAPGLDLQTTVGSGGIRGMWVLGSTLYVVSGNAVYSLSTSYAATFIGTLSTSSGPVDFADNGTQIALVDGVGLYLISGGVLTTPSLPFALPVTLAYQDGFGLTNAGNSNSFYQSNLNDLSTWNSLNFGQASADSDNIVALASLHREIWVFKQYHTEIWINAGLSGFAFQRLQGVYIEAGCAAAFSVATAGERIFWLGQAKEGTAVVFEGSGYQPRRISTHAIEFAISGYSSISDAIGYCYEQEGHLFYVLTFPTGNQTWVYDVTVSAELGFPAWHQRAALSSGTFGRHWGQAFAYFNGMSLVGDYDRNGSIYAYNLNTLTDNGTQRKWLRSWRAFHQPVDSPTAFRQLTIDLDTGNQVPQSANPQLMLRWANDGGYNWSNFRLVSAGQSGQTTARAIFNRLGSTTRQGGLDRIFELSCSDQFRVALIGASLVTSADGRAGP